MDELEQLWGWIEANYDNLAKAFANYENPQRLTFVFYCIAMYIKHKGLIK